MFSFMSDCSNNVNVENKTKPFAYKKILLVMNSYNKNTRMILNLYGIMFKQYSYFYLIVSINNATY